MALLFTADLWLRRQRHHYVHGRRRHETRHYKVHTMLDQWVRALKLLVHRWLMALKLQRRWRKALESRQLVADDDTSEIWPKTGQIVLSRTKRQKTYKKTYVRTHDSENNVLATVLYQRKQTVPEQTAPAWHSG